MSDDAQPQSDIEVSPWRKHDGYWNEIAQAHKSGHRPVHLEVRDGGDGLFRYRAIVFDGSYHGDWVEGGWAGSLDDAKANAVKRARNYYRWTGGNGEVKP